jgi:hypothetical protein
MVKISIKQANDIDQKNAYRVTIDGEKCVVYTDVHGHGLWIDGDQVEGTGQFSLSGIADKPGKLRRYFSE